MVAESTHFAFQYTGYFLMWIGFLPVQQLRLNFIPQSLVAKEHQFHLQNSVHSSFGPI